MRCIPPSGYQPIDDRESFAAMRLRSDFYDGAETNLAFTRRAIGQPNEWTRIIAAAFSVVAICGTAAGESESQSTAPNTELNALVLEGPELHESLRTREVSSIRDFITGIVAPENPHVSLDHEFVHAVARGSSQGRLTATGMRAALYARYSTGEEELGIYGLEAETLASADEREKALRDIWAHNGEHGRSRVHRKGLVLLVVWHIDVPRECWTTVNATILEYLKTTDQTTRDDGG